jgi:hypothetical protein
MIDRYHKKNENEIKVGVLKCLLFTEENLCMKNAPFTYTPKFHQGLYEKV